MPIRLLIADAYQVVRAGVRALLAAEADVAVVAEAVTLALHRGITHLFD